MNSCTQRIAVRPAMTTGPHLRRGTIFLGGPPLVKAATGEIVTAEELGGGEMHSTVSGVTDHLADDDHHALQIVRSIVSTLPQTDPPPWEVLDAEDPAVDPEQLHGVIPADDRTPYDVREVIARLVDGSRFHEFKQLYGPTLVTGFAHIWGHPRASSQQRALFESALKGALHRSCAISARSRCCSSRTSPFMVGRRVRGRRHRQARRQDGQRRRDCPGAQAHGGDRRLVRAQLQHVRRFTRHDSCGCGRTRASR